MRRDPPFTAVLTRALSLCFRYRWVCIFSLFNIRLSYLLLLRIPFGMLLLSRVRQPIKTDHTVGSPHFLREKSLPHFRPLLGPKHHLIAGPLLYLHDWNNFTWNTEDTTKKRVRGKKSAMRSWVVGKGPTRQEINSSEIFLTKVFFFLSLSAFFYLVSCQTSPVKLARGSCCQRVNHSNIDLIM